MEIEIEELILEDEIELCEIELEEELKLEELELDVIIEGSISPDYDMYKGSYNITPLAYNKQELETKNKIMEKNLIVKEVPFFEVSNTEGTTVYIGSEV